MMTEWISMSAPEEAERGLRLAAELFKHGEVVAFPTETVYGLGASIESEEGLGKIFEAKGRPSDNPLIVHVYPGYDLSNVVFSVTPQAKALMDRFWPGPLTLIFPKAPGVSDRVTAGLPTVAVRMPSHPVAMAMLKAAGVGIAAPSANRSGRPSPTTAAHVWEDMEGRIPLILDGGSAQVGLESTIVDMTVEPPMLLRPGGIPAEKIREVVPELVIDPGIQPAADVTPKAPGLKYRHYAPKAPAFMAVGSPEEQERAIRRALRENKGRKRGVLTTDEHARDYEAETVIAVGAADSQEEMSAHLFDALRQFDHEGCDVIFCETTSETGLGLAYMNRLRKACGGKTLPPEQNDTQRPQAGKGTAMQEEIYLIRKTADVKTTFETLKNTHWQSAILAFHEEFFREALMQHVAPMFSQYQVTGLECSLVKPESIFVTIHANVSGGVSLEYTFTLESLVYEKDMHVITFGYREKLNASGIFGFLSGLGSLALSAGGQSLLMKAFPDQEMIRVDASRASFDLDKMQGFRAVSEWRYEGKSVTDDLAVESLGVNGKVFALRLKWRV